MDDERRIDGGLAAAIFLIPQVFGWLVFRPGYSIIARLVVILYMVLASIPLYFLIVTLWTSGDQIETMAKDFHKNKEVAKRNVDSAKSYMDDYETGEINSKRLQGEKSGGIIKTRADDLMRSFEHGGPGIQPYLDKTVVLNGTASAAPQGDRVFLQGNDIYPAITLHYKDDAPDVDAGDEVIATCSSISMATSGPDLSECR